MKILCYLLNIIFILTDCSSALSWTLSADFELGKPGDIAKGQSGFTSAGKLTVFSPEKSVAGKQSAQIKWLAGSDGWAKSHGTFVYPQKKSEGGEIWIRGYFYFKSPWSFKASPFAKLIRIHVADMSGKHLGYHSIIFDSHGNIILSNEIVDRQPSSTSSLYVDKWQCLEMYVKLSSMSGVVRIWRDGFLVFEEKKIKTLKNTTDFADFSYFMTYWNGGAPQDQTEYVDEIVVTTDTPAQRDKKGNPMIGSIADAELAK